MFKFSEFVFSIVVEDLGMFNFSKMTCLRFASLCLIQHLCLGTLSVLFWCQTKVFWVSPSPPLSPHPPSVSQSSAMYFIKPFEIMRVIQDRGGDPKNLSLAPKEYL